MSGYSLEVWLASQLREVEESGAICTRIVLRSADNGTPWNTWQLARTGPEATDPSLLLEEMHNVKNGLAEQFPVGKNQVLYISYDADGCELSRFPTFIMGKNKQPGANNLLQNEIGQSLSQTMTAFADTFRSVLSPVNAQFSLMMKHTEQLQNTIITQGRYIEALQMQRISDMENESKNEDATQQLVGVVKEQLPVALEIAKMTVQGKQADKIAKLQTLTQQTKTAGANGSPPTKEN